MANGKTFNDIKRRPGQPMQSGLNVLSDPSDESFLTGAGPGTFAIRRTPEEGGVSARTEEEYPGGVDEALQRLALRPDVVHRTGTFVPILDPETGESRTEFREDIGASRLISPDLQAYIDNPDLAKLEQAISVVRTTDPTDERLTPEQKRAYNQAQEIVETAAAPGPRPTGALMQRPGEQERQQFIDFVIQRQFGGQDPRMANPVQEAFAFTEDQFEQWYEQSRSGTDLNWWTLTDSQKEKFKQIARSNYIDQRKVEVDNQVQMLEGLIGRYETERDRKIKFFEIGEQRAREASKASSSLRARARKQIVDLGKEETKAHNDLAKAQAEALQASGRGPEAKADAQARVEQIRGRIADIQAQKAEARRQATKEETAEGTAVTDFQGALAEEGAEGAAEGRAQGLGVGEEETPEGEIFSPTHPDLQKRPTDDQLPDVTEDEAHEMIRVMRKKYPKANQHEIQVRAIRATRKMLGKNPFTQFKKEAPVENEDFG